MNSLSIQHRELNTGIIIPALNEEDSIGEVITEAFQYVNHILVIDDGSRDETTSVAQQHGAVVIKHQDNQGKGNALKTGFAYAIRNGWDAVITMDADKQHSPDDITKFLVMAADPHIFVIIGNRMENVDSMPLVRCWINRLMSTIISRLARQHIPDSQCGFRLFKTEILKDLVLETSTYDTESEIIVSLARNGVEMYNVSVSTVYDVKEGSKIDPVLDTIRFIHLLSRLIEKNN